VSQAKKLMEKKESTKVCLMTVLNYLPRHMPKNPDIY